jgi:hypothetical protein
VLKSRILIFDSDLGMRSSPVARFGCEEKFDLNKKWQMGKSSIGNLTSKALKGLVARMGDCVLSGGRAGVTKVRGPNHPDLLQSPGYLYALYIYSAFNLPAISYI